MRGPFLCRGRTAECGRFFAFPRGRCVRRGKGRFLVLVSLMRRPFPKIRALFWEFKKMQKILHWFLTSGGRCGILRLRLGMTNHSADTERRRTWERRTLRGTTGGADRKRSFFPSRQTRKRGCGPVWLTPVMIGISPLSFPSFPVFLMNGPGRTPYRPGPNAARFQLCVPGAGGGFAKALAPLPTVLYNKSSYAAGAESRRANKKEESLC